MSGFSAREVMKGIYHIRDAMGVFMTLLTGRDGALLIDSGYGLEDVSSFINGLTDKPVRLMLTHAHHDHALGARWFREAYLFPEDREAFSVYTGAETRARVVKQAEEKGIAVPEDFLTAEIPAPAAAREGTIDLGGLNAQVILCPGHTPGSAVVYVPERKLMLTGDNWNPCTWLFFPEALAAEQYRENMKKILKLPFDWALCPHREALYPRGAVDSFFDGLTDETLLRAKPVQMGRDLDTREAQPTEGQQFVFEFGRTALAGRD